MAYFGIISRPSRYRNEKACESSKKQCGRKVAAKLFKSSAFTAKAALLATLYTTPSKTAVCKSAVNQQNIDEERNRDSIRY
jgi:hypothetical protein